MKYECIICDVCGKKVEKAEKYYKIAFGEMRINMERYSGLEEYDVCQDCYQKVKRILNLEEGDTNDHDHV